ncbi:MAG: PQQ-like beta-propeller repeat protein [Pirellulales bacterium]|nr:PQQ-like beta-propeller repeat protein [Pirellulales bacterium]
MNSRAVRLWIALSIACWFVAPDAGFCADWPTFRGPQRTGVATDSGLLDEWPEGGPPLVWKIEGTGRGYSSLAIVGNRLYTLGDNVALADDKDEYLMCFDLTTRDLLWKCKTGPAFTEVKTESWQSSRSTPTVDGDRVYVLSPLGELVCCNSATGKALWRKDMRKDFNGKKDDQWGYSESVTIDGKYLICTPGGKKNTMVALDKRTGKLHWHATQPDNRGAGHASIVKAKIGDVPVYVQTTGSGALGVRATDGKLLWSYPLEKSTAVIPTPIVRGDLVLMVVGYKKGVALLKQVSDGPGNVKIDEIYPLKPALANKHGGVVLVGDYFYGDSDDQGIPYCAELLTGEQKWKERGSGKGSVATIAADGHLYLCFADGTVVLAKASPNKYVEISKFTAPGSGERPSWAHPVILDGKLYLREHNMILCYDIRDPKKAATASMR